MWRPPRVGLVFSGDGPKMHRLVTYWLLASCLYVLFTGVLWVEVLSGAAHADAALRFTVFAVIGQVLFYLLIRLSDALAISPASLSEFQGRFAIVCAVLGYAIIGPLRGATLLVLLVILVFCAFTLEAKRTHALGVFAIALLGLAMIWLTHTYPEEFDPRTELKHFVLVSATVGVVGFLTGRMSAIRSALMVQKEELTSALDRIQELATQDELTALPNRRHMTALLSGEVGRGGVKPACLALLDLDWFKRINDTYGHAVGDNVLREFALQGRLVLRQEDVFARWGGEEFLLYLPDTDLSAAMCVVERLRVQVATRRFTHDNGHFGITFSAGLVELQAGESMDCGIGKADALLYTAKADGRDRIATAHTLAAV